MARKFPSLPMDYCLRLGTAKEIRKGLFFILLIPILPANSSKKKIYSYFHGFKFQKKWENYMAVFVHPLMLVSKMCGHLRHDPQRLHLQ